MVKPEPVRTRPTLRSRMVTVVGAAHIGCAGHRAASRPARDIGTGWSDTERERLPPVIECRKPCGDGQRHGPDVLEVCCFAQLGQVTFPCPGQLRLVARLRIDVVHSPPERGERTAASGVIPHACSDHTAGTGDPSHLRQPGHWICHEVHD